MLIIIDQLDEIEIEIEAKIGRLSDDIDIDVKMMNYFAWLKNVLFLKIKDIDCCLID